MARSEPLRSCLGCREVKPKEELLRFVLDPEGNPTPDIAGKLPGRGAYTCFRSSCLAAAVKRKQFSRAFKAEVRTASAEELSAIVMKMAASRAVSALAMANKAGRVISGSEKVMDALRKGGVALLILAGDISEDSAAKFRALASKSPVQIFSFADKDQLGAALGKEIRSAAALVPGALADNLSRELTRYWNFFEGGAK